MKTGSKRTDAGQRERKPKNAGVWERVRVPRLRRRRALFTYRSAAERAVAIFFMAAAIVVAALKAAASAAAQEQQDNYDPPAVIAKHGFSPFELTSPYPMLSGGKRLLFCPAS